MSPNEPNHITLKKKFINHFPPTNLSLQPQIIMRHIVSLFYEQKKIVKENNHKKINRHTPRKIG